MIDAGWLASVAGFAVVMSATPGPNNALVAASGARFGLRRTLPQVFGVALGFPVMLVLVGVGAGGMLRAVPALQEALRWVGVGWLLWLAWKLATAPVAVDVESVTGRPMGLWQMAALQWVNPKAWAVAGGAILAYGADRLAEATTLAAIFAVAAVPCLVAWAALGAGLAPLLRRRPGALRAFNLAMAGLLAASVLPLLAG